MEALRPRWAVRVIIVMVITAIFFRCVTATNHSVGGASGWDLSSNIQDWSAATTFQVGDYLVFNYLPVHDVLEVNRTDFSNCHTVNPISTHSDGETAIHLKQPGTRYFICGRFQHCLMGLKLRVQVLQRLSNSTDSPSPPPQHPSAPSPPLPEIPVAGSPCICSDSGVAEVMKGGPLKWWWWLFFITLATHPSLHSIGFVSETK